MRFDALRAAPIRDPMIALAKRPIAHKMRLPDALTTKRNSLYMNITGMKPIFRCHVALASIKSILYVNDIGDTQVRQFLSWHTGGE